MSHLYEVTVQDVKFLVSAETSGEARSQVEKDLAEIATDWGAVTA